MDIISIGICALGIFIIIHSVYLFRKNETSVNPIDFSLANSLVTDGGYKISRNPMYLGFLLIIVSFGLYKANEVILFSVFFFLYMNRFQIIPEEKELGEIFGEEYQHYKSKVNRWIGLKIS